MGEYLAIKNWRKYQSLRTKGPWIKDYPDQVDDPTMSGLSMFVRGVLQELRRVRGRTGKNIPNDLRYIARATHAIPTDIPPLKHALATLLARGLLILTNQEVDSAKPGEKEIEKEIEKESKPSASAKPRGTLPNPAKVSNSTGETRHHRIEQIVRGWYRDWAGVDCPWDGGEASQLSRMLKAWPNQPDQQFVTCLDHLARSDCIPKGDRPREWLGKLPKFIQGPLDQYWKPKGMNNGNARATDRATQSTAEIDSAVARLSGRAAKENQGEVPPTTGERSVSGLVGRLAKAFPGGGDGAV